MVRGIRDGSVEDILQCQMALFCVKCVLEDTVAAVNTQPSSVFETAVNFTFISCHLTSCIIIIIIIIISITIIITITITIIINVLSATALAMALNCQQVRLQVKRFASSNAFPL